MSRWVLRGIRTGIKATQYPDRPENRAGVSPGLPAPGKGSEDLVALCPTDALSIAAGEIAVNASRCIHCFRCARTHETKPLDWQSGYEWADSPMAEKSRAEAFPETNVFDRSLQILVVDGGDCGACLSEIAQLSGPYYNLHRLGFFITPTPRNADILLLVGPVTDQMKDPVLKAYSSMPPPKRVVAAGACAASGGIFGPSFISSAGAADVVPVDVVVPGCPPPPLALLHGLLVAVGRKPGLSAVSPVPIAEPEEREIVR